MVEIVEKDEQSEVDKVFKETVEHWKGLAEDVHGEMYEILGAMNITKGIDPSEFDSEDLANLIKVVRRFIESTHDKVDRLQESISSAGLIKPIDELEGKVIGALRVLRKDVCLVNASPQTELYKSLAPLFTLAEKEGFSFPDWIRNYVHLPKDE